MDGGEEAAVPDGTWMMDPARVVYSDIALRWS